MRGVQPVRFEQGRPMLLAGIRRTHSFADMGEGIPRQWEEFIRLGALPGQVGTAAYGAICGSDMQRQTMEYLCGLEVRSFDELPRELGRMRVPQARYAVFVHEGSVATIRDTWQQIFSVWLPRSSFVSNETPDFELYGDRFDAVTGNGVEIWIGVAAKS